MSRFMDETFRKDFFLPTIKTISDVLEQKIELGIETKLVIEIRTWGKRIDVRVYEKRRDWIATLQTPRKE